MAPTAITLALAVAVVAVVHARSVERAPTTEAPAALSPRTDGEGGEGGAGARRFHLHLPPGLARDPPPFSGGFGDVWFPDVPFASPPRPSRPSRPVSTDAGSGFEERPSTRRPLRDRTTRRPDRTTTPRPSRSRNSLLNPEECGPLGADRIIGGNMTVVMELPWMVRLGYDSTLDPSFNCGGSLINSRYVLTAAHCVGSGEDPVMVRLGEHDSQRSEDCSLISGAEVCAPPVVDVDVEKVIRHTGFSSNTLMNDIALLRLARPVEFTAAVKPICLPTSRVSFNPLVGKNGAVAGWGKGMNQAVRGTRYLMKANVPFTSFSSCEREYGKRGIELDEQSQVCAGGKQGVDSCQGDSGGPLYRAGEVSGRDGPVMLQYGVVSFGLQKCAVKGVPGIYTRVDHYLDWITSNMRP